MFSSVIYIFLHFLNLESSNFNLESLAKENSGDVVPRESKCLKEVSIMCLVHPKGSTNCDHFTLITCLSHVNMTPKRSPDAPLTSIACLKCHTTGFYFLSYFSCISLLSFSLFIIFIITLVDFRWTILGLNTSLSFEDSAYLSSSSVRAVFVLFFYCHRPICGVKE